MRVIRQTPQGERAPTFYFQNLPDSLWGAQVCRNGFSHAVEEAMGRRVLVQAVGEHLPQEALSLSSLQPGEFVYEWNEGHQTMVLVRQGTQESGEAQ